MRVFTLGRKLPFATSRQCATAASSVHASVDALIKREGKADGSSPWQSFTEDLIRDTKGQRPKDIASFTRLVETLTMDAELAQGEFWYEFTDSMKDVINLASLEELIPVARNYAFLNCRSEVLFNRVVREGQNLLDKLEADQIPLFVDVLDVLGKAKVSNRLLFRNTADHLVDDGDLVQAFSDDQLIRVIESMADLGVRHDPLFRHLGRQRLHNVDLQSSQAARLARAYGLLGYRHDTIFKKWVKELLQFHEKKRHETKKSFSLGEMTFIVEAMILTKRYRGKTEWWDADQDFGDLIAILARRLTEESDKSLILRRSRLCVLDVR